MKFVESKAFTNWYDVHEDKGMRIRCEIRGSRRKCNCGRKLVVTRKNKRQWGVAHW